MKPIGIFYGSNSGNTEDSAEQIQHVIGESFADIYNVADTPVEFIAEYDYVILGIPTWDFGGLEPDWENAWPELEALSFEGKQVALFGQGDQLGFDEWFLDAVGDLYEVVVARGAKVVGFWPVQGYDFEESRALNEAKTHFVGLGLDEDNQAALSDTRIKQWCTQVMDEFGLIKLLETA